MLFYQSNGNTLGDFYSNDGDVSDISIPNDCTLYS